jgi:hypothetical protein
MTATGSGLSPERTRFAWRRAALSGTVVALLTVRLAIDAAGGPAVVALAGLAVVGWLGLLAVAFRGVRGMGQDRPPPVGRAVGLVALTIGYAGLGVALVVLG